MLWDSDTGNWVLQNWTNGDSLNARMGSWSRRLRRDRRRRLGSRRSVRRHDHLGPRHRQLRGPVLVAATSTRTAAVARGRVATTKLIAGDFDGDGYVNDTMLWDQSTGNVGRCSAGSNCPLGVSRQRHLGSAATTRSSSATGAPAATSTRRSCGIVRPDSGRCSHGRTFDGGTSAGGYWSTAIDYRGSRRLRHRRPRRRPFPLRRSSTGSWSVWSFHRTFPRRDSSGTWLNGYDVIMVGSFMD